MKNPKWLREAEEQFRLALKYDQFDAECYVGLGDIYETEGMTHALPEDVRAGGELRPGERDGPGEDRKARRRRSEPSRSSSAEKKTRPARVGRKPNSVPPAGRPAKGDDHFSSRDDCSPGPATYPEASDGPPSTLPYLVLLRVGFTLPWVSPPKRCALTAPFHPYRLLRSGGMFSVALSFRSPGLAISQHTALWSSDFPLAPQPAETGAMSQRSSDRLEQAPALCARERSRFNRPAPVEILYCSSFL